MKLFTSGCSLTHQNCSWAYQLANIKGYELHNYAFPCIGNGIIAKRLIYNLEKMILNSLEDALKDIKNINNKSKERNSKSF